MDEQALRRAVAVLYDRGIHSVRQHQKMVGKALRTAFDRYVFRPNGEGSAVVVDDALYAEAMDQGDYVTVKRAGF